jgi:hypothetical protein
MMNRIQAHFEATQEVVRIAMFWLFGDVIYAVLPLIVIAILTRLLNLEFKEFLLLKEWSFASIVLYGAAIRRTIKLKTEIQRVPRHWTLEMGVQFIIPWLIGSVIVLAVVILMELGIIPKNVTVPIAAAQLIFFLMASFLVLAVVLGEALVDNRLQELPTDTPRFWVMTRVGYRLDDVSNDLLYVIWAFDRLRSQTYRSHPDPGWERLGEQERLKKLENSVLSVERLTKAMRGRLESMSLPGPEITEKIAGAVAGDQ